MLGVAVCGIGHWIHTRRLIRKGQSFLRRLWEGDNNNNTTIQTYRQKSADSNEAGHVRDPAISQALSLYSSRCTDWIRISVFTSFRSAFDVYSIHKFWRLFHKFEHVQYWNWCLRRVEKSVIFKLYRSKIRSTVFVLNVSPIRFLVTLNKEKYILKMML